MRRFTILGLMAVVLGVAIAAAALRNADEYWAGGLMLGTAFLIGMATLGAFYHSGRRRASRLGFVVFGGAYFALAFLGLSDQNLAKLPTTWLLLYIHERVGPPQTFNITYTLATSVQGTVLTSNVSPGSTAYTITAPTSLPFNLASGVNSNPPTRWSSLLPGAANYEAFGAVGHCLFALVAGLMGMLIARRYQAKLDQDDRRGRQTTGEPAPGIDG